MVLAVELVHQLAHKVVMEEIEYFLQSHQLVGVDLVLLELHQIITEDREVRGVVQGY